MTPTRWHYSKSSLKLIEDDKVLLQQLISTISNWKNDLMTPAQAAAIAKGEAPVNGCPVGGDAVGKVIADHGTGGVETVRQTAFVKCTGTCEKQKAILYTPVLRTVR